MLRRLTWPALILVIAYGGATASQTPKHVAESSAATEQGEPDKRGTEASPLVVNEHTIQTKEEIAQQDARDAEQRHVNRWLIGLTFGLVIAAFLQIAGIATQVWVYLKQTKIMKSTLTKIGEQSVHMGNQLEEMKRQADHMAVQSAAYVNAERARITIVFVALGSSYRIDMKNSGNAMAKILYARGNVITLTPEEHLPINPPYLSESMNSGDFSEWMNKDETLEIESSKGGYGLLVDLSDQDVRAAIRDNRKRVVTYGRIVYEDGITPEKRETRFCYEAAVDGLSLHTNMVQSGSPIYRMTT